MRHKQPALQPLHDYPKANALPPLADVNVDVEIDLGHAFLRRLVRAAFMPAAFARSGIPDIGQSQAAPLRKRARTLAGELPGQHDLFAVSIGADDVRAQDRKSTRL